jgi:hypothetical protein
MQRVFFWANFPIWAFFLRREMRLSYSFNYSLDLHHFFEKFGKKGKKKKDMYLDTFSDQWQLVCHIWCKVRPWGEGIPEIRGPDKPAFWNKGVLRWHKVLLRF